MKFNCENKGIVMKCDKCESNRILSVGACCSDLCSVEFNGVGQSNYVPRDIGLGGGDYVEFNVCLECGKVQGQFPIKDPEFAQRDNEE